MCRYSHPAVEGVMYSGFWDGEDTEDFTSFVDGAGLTVGPGLSFLHPFCLCFVYNVFKEAFRG